MKKLIRFHLSSAKNRLPIFCSAALAMASIFAPSVRAADSAAAAGGAAAWFVKAKTNRPDIYHAGWIDFNKNGRQDVFEDPTQPVDKRVEDLLSQMTVEEKTCQLATLYGYRRVLKDPLPTPDWKNQIWRDGVANIDEMHNGVGHSGDADNPYVATPAATAKALNEVQRWFIEETRLGIPAEFSNEGVRGANYRKTVNFPADIALGATWDRDLLTAVGDVVARESKAIG